MALAASGDHRASVEVLLDARADPNAANRAGKTALMLAAAKGQTESVELLLARNAAVVSRSASGETALSKAVGACRFDVVKVLIGKGALAGKTGAGTTLAGGMTLLMLASASCAEAIALIDVGAGSPHNAVDDRGRTALWWAADRGNAAAVKVLLEKGADSRIADQQGSFPLLRAVANGEREAAQLLLVKGGRVRSAHGGGQYSVDAGGDRGRATWSAVFCSWGPLRIYATSRASPR